MEISANTESSILPPNSIGGYRLLTRLGGSASGEVYLAQGIRRGERVVLRLVEGELSRLEALRDAAKVWLKIRHPGLVPLKEVQIEQGILYFVYPFLVGASLDHISARGMQSGQQPVDGKRYLSAMREQLEEADRVVGDEKFWQQEFSQIVVDLTAQISKTLYYLHSCGFAHGDLKESHVFVTPFGRALLLSPAIPVEEASAEKDLLAIGEIFRKSFTFFPEQNAEVLERIAYAATSAYPADRYISLRAFAEDLGRFMNSEPVLAKLPGTITKTFRSVQKRPARAAAMFVILVLAAAVTALELGWLDETKSAPVKESYKTTSENKIEKAPKILESEKRVQGPSISPRHNVPVFFGSISSKPSPR